MKNSERGAALIYVLIAAAAMFAMMGIVHNNLSELRSTLGVWTWKMKAEAAAESAIEVAGLRLLDDPKWKSGEDTTSEMQISLSDAQARIQTKHIRPDLIAVTSIGRHRTGRSRVGRTAHIVDPTLFCLIGRKQVTLGFGTSIRGSGLSGEEMTIDRGVNMVHTSLISGRSVNMTVAYPAVQVFESAKNLPDLSSWTLDDLKKTYKSRLATSVLTDVRLAGRALLRDGSLNIVGGEFSDVSIFVAGDLRIAGTPKMSSKGDTPILIVEKDLTANLAGAEIRGVIYVGGKATIRGQGVIIGTIIAEEMDIGGGIAVQSFDEDVLTKRPTPSFFIREIRWIKGGEKG